MDHSRSPRPFPLVSPSPWRLVFWICVGRFAAILGVSVFFLAAVACVCELCLGVL